MVSLPRTKNMNECFALDTMAQYKCIQTGTKKGSEMIEMKSVALSDQQRPLLRALLNLGRFKKIMLMYKETKPENNHIDRQI